MKEVLKILIILLIGFGLGMLFEKHIGGSKPIDPSSVVIPDSIIAGENHKIDTLKITEEKERIKEIYLKDSVKTITKIKYVKVDSIKKLPLDSGILYLKSKLDKYEK